MSDRDSQSPYQSQSQSQSPQAQVHPPRLGNRRPHRKSRTGCKNCKRRKVKCDETKPACANCIRFSMICDLTPSFEQKNLTQEPPAPALPRKGRGRPRKDWIPIRYVPRKSGSRSSPNPATRYEVMPRPDMIPNVEHLDLIHSWCVNTAATVGAPKVWREGIPPLSLDYPCLCHSMMAMSARHLSILRPLEAERYRTIAEDHYIIAVTEATRLLARLNGDIAQVMYGTTVLLALCSFARGPTPGDLLVFAHGKTVPWVCLLQGVKLIVQTLGHPAIFYGIFAPDLNQKDDAEPIPIDTRLLPNGTGETWQQPLNEVLEMIEQTCEFESESCVSEMKNLIASYEVTYGTEHDPKVFIKGQFQDIMGWIYRMDDDFAVELEAQKPIPLIILAYFAVLLKSLEGHWYMKGWADHLLQEIRPILDPQYAKWLDWPEMQIQYSGAETTLPIHAIY